MATYQVTKRVIADITYTVADVENEDEALEAVVAGEYDSKESTIIDTVSYTHLTLPTILRSCRSRWSPYH